MNSASTQVSLIIPCYNHADTLERAVVSGLKQGEACGEIIIVDDASSDRSLSEAKRLCSLSDRICTHALKRNSGPAVARNAGAKLARYPLISFLDADDELINPAFFATAASVIHSNPQMKVVKAEMEFFDPVKGYILPAYDPRHASAVLSSACGMVVTRALFLSLKGFPEDAVFRGDSGGEDVVLMHALISFAQPLGRIDVPSYRVWSRDGSHLDRFLSRTRLTDDKNAFISCIDQQVMSPDFSNTLDTYIRAAAKSVARKWFKD